MTVEAIRDARYVIDDAGDVVTPSLAVYPDLIRGNLLGAIELAGKAERIRPHVKTHKTAELIRLELDAGIVKHKCATIAEAELLARTGVTDVVLAYSLVGPNIKRFAALQQLYPTCVFLPLADHPAPASELADVMTSDGQTAEVLMDLDVGMGRTGIAPGPEAIALYRLLHETDGLKAGGLHVYDGQNHQHDPAERAAAVDAIWNTVREFVGEIESYKLPVPRLVCGNSATYPRWAQLAVEDVRIECSPGTFFLNDWNYYHWFQDIPFQPAAVLLTRVVSKPRPGRLTLDLGYKAVASDSPLKARVKLLDLPDAEIIVQNEEHLVVDTAEADRYAPGDLLYAWPAHICPTCALHRDLLVVRDHRVVGHWTVVARDRILDV